MTTESVFIMEESRVVQLCAIITRGAMTENSVFNLLILANTATGIIVVHVCIWSIMIMHIEQCTIRMQDSLINTK